MRVHTTNEVDSLVERLKKAAASQIRDEETIWWIDQAIDQAYEDWKKPSEKSYP